jgi:hypothetical protein
VDLTAPTNAVFWNNIVCYDQFHSIGPRSFYKTAIILLHVCFCLRTIHIVVVSMSTLSPFEQEHANRLAAHVDNLLSMNYNMRDIYTFKLHWPEQPWWMVDMVSAHPGSCRHANDPVGPDYGCQCFHVPRCRGPQLRCSACDSDSHFAFYGCPKTASILNSMRITRSNDEKLLLIFAKYSLESTFPLKTVSSVGNLTVAQERHIRNAWAFLAAFGATKNKSRSMRCLRHKFDL